MCNSFSLMLESVVPALLPRFSFSKIFLVCVFLIASISIFRCQRVLFVLFNYFGFLLDFLDIL